MEDGNRYSRGVRSFEQDIGRAARDDDDTRVTDPGGGEVLLLLFWVALDLFPAGSNVARGGRWGR